MGEYIPSAPINDEAKKNNKNLPGMGGVFNHINLSLYHYAGNNPVRYLDPDGRLSKDSQGKLKKRDLGTYPLNNSNSKLNVVILYTNKGNPIIGVKNDKYFNPDLSGKEFADGEYSLQPGFLTNKNYKDLSIMVGSKMTREDNLATLLKDDCIEISKQDAKSGDLLIRFDVDNKNNKYPVMHGKLEKIKKTILGYKFTIERDGKLYTYSEKDFSNGFKIYRKVGD